LALGLGLLCALQSPAWAQEEADPFAESQLEQIAAPSAEAATALVVSGFVDAGYVRITQTGPGDQFGDLSWAFGNSQSNFSTTADTFTVNEVDLTFRAEKHRDGLVTGAVASIDFYPSRDDEIYQGGPTDRPIVVDQAFVFVQFTQVWNSRIRLGRAPGVATLEQLTENEAPQSRLVGHTYVYQAGGGYPYGVQLMTEPAEGMWIHLGQSNGGLGDYTFFPNDRSTANRPVAPDEDQDYEGAPPDRLKDKTVYAAFDWVVFDRPAEWGRFQVGLAYASNPGLTYNAAEDRVEPYTFSNGWLAYRVSDYEARLEVAGLETYYSAANSLGSFEAGLYSLLLSYELGAAHLFTLRYEQADFLTDVDPDQTGQAVKYGLTYRLRIGDPMVLKLEYVTETQSPQYYTMDGDLTTNVLALSWVYAF
jgi:hypothetical protein